MAEENPELQAALRELDRELEVCNQYQLIFPIMELVPD
jgi:hypothetical protein